jgi:hypothetical protein
LGARKKIEITIQTERRLVIRGSVSGRAWCQQCGAETEVVTLETAGVVAQAVSVELGSTWPTGDLHLSQAPDGASGVCLKSLLGRLRNAGSNSGSGLVKGLLANE